MAKKKKKRILLVATDSKIPNIVICKLSEYYKNDNVDFIDLKYSGYPKKKRITKIDGSEYDKVYVSTIFTVNKDVVEIENCNNVEYGGSGIDLEKELPPEIENCELNYSLYPDNEISYGFITRGCNRKCSFCFVPKKEGKIREYSSVNDIIKHKKVCFLDNNILGYKNHKQILQELVDKKIRCEFNQGLDIRLLDEENAKLLSQMNYMGEYVFAFDDIAYTKIMDKQIQLLKTYIPKDWKIKLFIYHSEETMSIKDTLFRIKWCRENRCLPYLMRDKNCWETNNKEFLIDLAAYCNQPSIFKKMDFEIFLSKRHKNEDRKEGSWKIWTENM